MKHWLRKNRWKVLSAAGAVTVLVSLWWTTTGEPQPVYDGKPILAYFPEWVSPKTVSPVTIWFTPTGQRVNGPVAPPFPVGNTASGTAVFGPMVWSSGTGVPASAGPEAVPWLLRVIRRDDSFLKRLYLKHENRLPPFTRKWIPVPVTSGFNRGQAVSVLMQVARKSPQETGPWLAKALENGTDHERQAAARAVDSPEILTERVRSALVANLTYHVGAVQRESFDALRRWSEFDASTFTVMTTYWIGLGPDRPRDWHFSGLFGRTTQRQILKFRTALPDLAKLRTNASALARVEASCAAWLIDPADRTCGTELLREFVGNDADAKFKAGDYLVHHAAGMNLQADDAVPTVVAAMKKGGRDFRTRAIQILAHFKADALPALPELKIALRDPDRELRVASIRAIEAIGPTASNAIPALVESLIDPIVQAKAAEVLGRFGSAAAAAVPKLVELVANPARFAGSAELRSNSARALGRIGIANETVLDALRQAAGDSDPRIRVAASQALQRLDPSRPEDRTNFAR